MSTPEQIEQIAADEAWLAGAPAPVRQHATVDTPTADMEALLAMPANAPEILRWLLDGPMTFGAIVARRIRHRYPSPIEDLIDDAGRRAWAIRSVIYDLNAVDGWIEFDDLAHFTLGDRERSAIEMYDRIARHSQRQNHERITL